MWQSDLATVAQCAKSLNRILCEDSQCHAAIALHQIYRQTNNGNENITYKSLDLLQTSVTGSNKVALLMVYMFVGGTPMEFVALQRQV